MYFSQQSGNEESGNEIKDDGRERHLGLNRVGMERVFFILRAFAFALPQFTRVKCKYKRKCKRKEMKNFPFLVSALVFAFALWLAHVCLLVLALAFALLV